MDKGRRPTRTAAQKVVTYNVSYHQSGSIEDRLLAKALRCSLIEAEAAKHRQAKFSARTKDRKTVQALARNKLVKKAIKNIKQIKKSKENSHKDEKTEKQKNEDLNSKNKKSNLRDEMKDEKDKQIEVENVEEVVAEEPVKFKYSATRKFPSNYRQNLYSANAEPIPTPVKSGRKSKNGSLPEVEEKEINVLGTSDVSTEDFLNFLCCRDIRVLKLSSRKKQDQKEEPQSSANEKIEKPKSKASSNLVGKKSETIKANGKSKNTLSKSISLSKLSVKQKQEKEEKNLKASGSNASKKATRRSSTITRRSPSPAEESTPPKLSKSSSQPSLRRSSRPHRPTFDMNYW